MSTRPSVRSALLGRERDRGQNAAREGASNAKYYAAVPLHTLRWLRPVAVEGSFAPLAGAQERPEQKGRPPDGRAP